MKYLLRKAFLVKEIKSKKGELHFQRWRLLNLWLFAVYIHRIFKSDEDTYLHNHPWNFLSYILSGGYIEVGDGWGVVCGPHSCHYRNHRIFHRIIVWSQTRSSDGTHAVTKPVTSLVITGPRLWEWGYKTSEGVLTNKEYRQRKGKELI